jgi:hypothetical protein
MAQPSQTALIKGPRRVVSTETTMLPGRRKTVTGKMSRPDCVGEAKWTDVK